MIRVVGIGAGGHAKVLIDALTLCGGHRLVGLTDANRTLWGTEVLGVPVLGGDDLLPSLREDGVEAVFIGVGGVGDNRGRQRIYEHALALGFRPLTIIHPAAIVAASATIGSGAMILAGSVVNPCARIGVNVIVNTLAVVEHDCAIGDHVHVATGARLASSVRVADYAHIGVGASIRQSVTVGRGALVGAGAAVVSDVADGAVVVGVPARPMAARRGPTTP